MKKNNMSGEANFLSKSETLSKSRLEIKKPVEKQSFKTLNEMTVNKLSKPKIN